jgi:hypothetical protein
MFGLFKKKPEVAPEVINSLVPMNKVVIVNACDILGKLAEDHPAHKYFKDTVDVYLDWSQTGTLQKLQGVDVILISASIILQKIDYRIKMEDSGYKNANRYKGAGVVDLLTQFLDGADYVNVYVPPKKNEGFPLTE